MFSANTGIVISGNTINGGTGAGIADFAGPQPLPSGAPTIANNTISSRGVGVRLSQAGATVSGNTISNSTQFGIWMQAASGGGTITGNTITSTVGVDCQDDSTGPRTAGTNNTWTANIGITSDPAGLCLPPPPTTTTTTHNDSAHDHDSISAGRHDDPASDTAPDSDPGPRHPAGNRPELDRTADRARSRTGHHRADPHEGASPSMTLRDESVFDRRRC